MPTIRAIASFLDRLVTWTGLEDDRAIERPLPVSEAGPEHVAFIGRTARDPAALLRSARAGLLIVDESVPLDLPALAGMGVAAVLSSPNARLDFLRVIRQFFDRPRPRGIHPSAVIDPSARIGKGVYVGPLCSIDADVEIGDDTVIFAGVHLYERVRIGRGVTIHAGTVIGADGYGYERNESGELEKFPQVGGVVIEDEVEIGANTCIDRGALGDTRICAGARIDNLVHIAHNVVVGPNAAVIAHAMVGGGVTIGAGAWIAPSACLRDRIHIGARSTVGLAALVTRDVPEEQTVLGSPARPIEEQKRLLASWAEAASGSG